MHLSHEALEALRVALAKSGLHAEPQSIPPEELEEFGLFLLDLTAAAIKTRERMRMSGSPLPPSTPPATQKPAQQMRLPGLGP